MSVSGPHDDDPRRCQGIARYPVQCRNRVRNGAGYCHLHMPAPLAFDAIPIERHWLLSMLLHDALGHASADWEECRSCDELASQSIRTLFGVVR